MRSAILKVVIAYLWVGSVDASLHWYAGTQDTPTAHSLKEWYLYRDPQNGKVTHIFDVDILLPAIVLGLAAGGLSARRTQKDLIWFALLLPAGVVALFPLYAVSFPHEPRIWWLSATNGERAGVLIASYFKAALFCLFFGGVGRNAMRQIQGRTQDVV